MVGYNFDPHRPYQPSHLLIHQPCRAMLHDCALLVTDDMAVNSQRDPRVRAPQLPLYDSRSCAGREQGTGRTVTHGMKPAAGNRERLQQRM